MNSSFEFLTLSVDSQACRGQSTRKNRQEIHWQNSANGNVPGKHVTVGQCYFEANRAERCLEGSQNSDTDYVSRIKFVRRNRYVGFSLEGHSRSMKWYNYDTPA